MAHHAPKDSSWIDRDHSKHKQSQGRQSATSSLAAQEAGAFPPDLAEQFLRHVLDYEDAPCTTHFHQLEEAGVNLPAPELVSDAQLPATLANLVAGLAGLRVFLSNTNHLSDRALYVSLWTEGLREEVALTADDEHFAWNLDLLGSGSARDIYLHLRYYADDEYRRAWAEQFPADEIPAHQDPPFDRDRHLPQASYGSTSSRRRHNRKNPSR